MNCVNDHREQADERATASEVPFTEKGGYPSWIARVDRMTRVMWLPSHQVLFSFSFTKVTYVALVGVCVSMVSNFYRLHFTQRTELVLH
jgi:hypothetical protein